MNYGNKNKKQLVWVRGLGAAAICRSCCRVDIGLVGVTLRNKTTGNKMNKKEKSKNERRPLFLSQTCDKEIAAWLEMMDDKKGEHSKKQGGIYMCPKCKAVALLWTRSEFTGQLTAACKNGKCGLRIIGKTLFGVGGIK